MKKIITEKLAVCMISAPQRPCYPFSGWKDEAGSVCQPGEKTAPTGDLFLTARRK